MGRVQKVQRINTLNNVTVFRFLIVPLLLSFVLSGCATTYRRVTPDRKKIPLVFAKTEIPEEQLLDVRIQIFDPGEIPQKKESVGLSKEVRKAESHFVPVQLKKTIQETGYWGSVRVVPFESTSDEVLVKGCIKKSNGEELIVEVDVTDATGKQWFNKKIIKSAASESMYTKIKNNKSEVFQNVYNRIANELSAYRSRMKPEQVKNIRQVAEMRFAEDMAPDAFEGYLKKNKGNKIFQIDHLPAEDDKSMARVQRVRGRDYMLVDTLDAYYEGLHQNMNSVYTQWRQWRLAEMNMIRRIEARTNAEKTKGFLIATVGIALAIADATNPYTGPSASTQALAAVVVGTGVAKYMNANQISKEANINRAALEELGASFSADIEPTVIEVGGQTIKLTGNAKVKYQQWRDVISKLYKIETESDEERNSVIQSSAP